MCPVSTVISLCIFAAHRTFLEQLRRKPYYTLTTFTVGTQQLQKSLTQLAGGTILYVTIITALFSQVFFHFFEGGAENYNCTTINKNNNKNKQEMEKENCFCCLLPLLCLESNYC